MRLSDVLSKPPGGVCQEIDHFLGDKKLSAGTHRNIRVGRAVRNYFCIECNDVRSYFSGEQLSCLIAGEGIISVDCVLSCVKCNSAMRTWYLVTCENDLFSRAPRVRVARVVEDMAGAVHRTGSQCGEFADLLERAEVARASHLGAGSIVYLRKIFEEITNQVAGTAKVSLVGQNGGKKPFRNLLEEVDEKHHIIPKEFSENGYKLFAELSGVVHGNSDETQALQKYELFRRLVVGIVENVRSSQELAAAVDSLGWSHSDIPSDVHDGAPT